MLDNHLSYTLVKLYITKRLIFNLPYMSFMTFLQLLQDLFTLTSKKCYHRSILIPCIPWVRFVPVLAKRSPSKRNLVSTRHQVMSTWNFCSHCMYVGVSVVSGWVGRVQANLGQG